MLNAGQKAQLLALAKEHEARQGHSFRTARTAGGTFCFTLSADVHLDERTSPAMYERTLDNIRADQPDFHLDLGNLFMTDKHSVRDEAADQYLAQRYYLGRNGCSIPVLLALGTHDGESAKYDDESSDSLAVWANQMRERLFPNPVPDSFYTGSNVPHPHSGLLQNYYAWEWGDVLFVVLDPFRYSTHQHGGNDGWGWSLGLTQYQWLAQTLAQSRAKVKFVFIHNLLCGDQAARGGVEVAAFNEWGGKNQDGSNGFKAHRPGWPEPVHQLLVRHHVAVVFKAHDNFFARQELDGIVYQMVPQPSFSGNDRIRDLKPTATNKACFWAIRDMCASRSHRTMWHWIMFGPASPPTRLPRIKMARSPVTARLRQTTPGDRIWRKPGAACLFFSKDRDRDHKT